MFGRYSPDSQHGGFVSIMRKLAVLFFRYTNDDLCNHTHQRHELWKWTREDNKFALHCYFRSNSTQRGYRKRMIESWEEWARFQTTSQRLAEEVRAIMKKDWFSELELLEIHQINRESRQQDPYTIVDTPNTEKQKHSDRKEPQSNNNNITHPNYTEQRLTQEGEKIERS